MRKVPLAEWFISQFIGVERGSAIYGDLEELAAAWGRLWFWGAYVRALISLGWRTGAPAFTAAIAASWLVFHRLRLVVFLQGVSFHFGLHQFHAGLFGKNTSHSYARGGDVVFVIAEFLFFAVPFLLVRFGWRDPMSKLASLLLFVAVPAWSIQAQLMDISCLLTLAVIAVALLFRRSRRDMTVLAASFLASAVTAVTFFVLQIRAFHTHGQSALFNPPFTLVIIRIVLPGVGGWAAFTVGAAVCLRLRRGAKVGNAPGASGQISTQT